VEAEDEARQVHHDEGGRPVPPRDPV